MLLKDEKVLISIIGEGFWSALVVVLFKKKKSELVFL